MVNHRSSFSHNKAIYNDTVMKGTNCTLKWVFPSIGMCIWDGSTCSTVVEIVLGNFRGTCMIFALETYYWNVAIFPSRWVR